MLLELPVDGRLERCELVRVSVRSDAYRLLAQVPGGGLVEHEPGPSRTWRGTVAGLPGSVVAAAERDDGLELVIRTPGDPEPLVAEPLAGGPRGWHVLRRGTPEIGPELVCGFAGPVEGGDPGDPGANDGAGASGGVAAGDICFWTAELAFDADSTYFAKLGGVEQVEARLEAVVNTLNAWYEADLDITHLISTIIVRTSPEDDPYSDTTIIAELLDEFVAYWNANLPGVQRDMAQLVSDRLFEDPDSGVQPVGNAYYRQVCTSLAYSVVRDVSGLACAAYVAAHELGHNWGADHCACSSEEGDGCPAGVCPPGEDCFCPGWIMAASFSCATVFHPVFSVLEMDEYRQSRPCIVDPCVPENDDCSGALIVDDGGHAFTTVYASTDGPPDNLCNVGGTNQIEADVWFRYVPACDGPVDVGVCDSDFDTRLAVYAAFCPATANLAIACDDDGCGAASQLSFAGQAGTAYLIRVGGTGLARGSGTLTIAGPSCVPPPPNDSCGSAVTIAEGTSTPFTTIGATTDGPEEPGACGGQVHQDVWYRFLAPCDGPMTIAVCGADFDTALVVYGPACPSSPGAALACNDDACGAQSRIVLDATAGTLYRVRVGSLTGATGSGSISLACGEPPDCPTDTDGNGVTDVDDLVAVILDWGTDGSGHNGDVNGSGGVDVDDLVAVILAWGPC
jgi:hypothetical protein